MNYQNTGFITSAHIVHNTTGWHVGDTILIPGHTSATLRVASVIGTQIGTISITIPGHGYNHKSVYPITGPGLPGASIRVTTGPPRPFHLPAGDGAIEQGGRWNPIVRQRTIQNTLATTLQKIAWRNNRTYLAGLAKYWSDTLTAGDRTGWDGQNPITGWNGFEWYMHCNKIAQPFAFTQPDISPWNGLPPYPLTATNNVPFSEPLFPYITISASQTSILVRCEDFRPNPTTQWVIALGRAPFGYVPPNRSPSDLFVYPGIELYRLGAIVLPPDDGLEHNIEIFNPFLNYFGTLRSGQRYLWQIYVLDPMNIRSDPETTYIDAFTCP